LAINLQGIPLGLVYQETWARNLKPERSKLERRWTATAEKESQRWIRTLAVCEKGIPDEKRVVLIAEREADMYDLFAAERRGNFHLLIRAVQNRRVTHPAEYLQEAVYSQPVAGQIEVEVGRQGDRPPRKVTLDIRFLSVGIRPPYRGVHRTQAQPIPLQVILAEEVSPPEGETAIVWWLITTLPVLTLADAQRCIRWYSFRWLIERFHFVLKSGCRIERLQFELADRLEKAIAVYSIVAWRLLWLTYQARISAEQSCLVAFQPHEWQALYCTIHKTTPPPDDPPSLHAAIRWIARLGGFLARKGDGEPGVQTIWTGLRRLDDIAATWLLLHPTSRTTCG
jgi:Transposase Tn5 dimerisation domain